MRALLLGLLVASMVHAQQFERFFQIPPQGGSSGSYLGVGVGDIDAEHARALKLDSEEGALVVRVKDGSPADKAGFRSGDVLLNYNGERILGSQQLGRLVWETPPGRHVKIQYLRDGKLNSAVVITAAPPIETTPMDLQRGSPGLSGMMMDIPVPLIAWKNLALGMECEPINAELAAFFGVKEGVLVRAVQKGSCSEKAGIRAGDVVIVVAGRSLSSPRDLSDCLRDQSEPGKPVQLGVMRNHKQIALNLTLPDPQ